MSVVFPTAGDSSSDYEDDDDWDWGDGDDDGDNASAAELWPHLSVGVSLPSPGSWPNPVPAASASSSSSSVHRSSNKDSNMVVDHDLVSRQSEWANPNTMPCALIQAANTDTALSKPNQLKRPSGTKDDYLPAKRSLLANPGLFPAKPNQSMNPQNVGLAWNSQGPGLRESLSWPESDQGPGQFGPSSWPKPIPAPGPCGPQTWPETEYGFGPYEPLTWPEPGPVSGTHRSPPWPEPYGPLPLAIQESSGPQTWPAPVPMPRTSESEFGFAEHLAHNNADSCGSVVMDSGNGRCLLLSGTAVPHKSMPRSRLPHAAASLVMEKWNVHISLADLVYVDFLGMGKNLIVIFSTENNPTFMNLVRLEENFANNVSPGNLEKQNKHLSIRPTGIQLDYKIFERLQWLEKVSCSPKIRLVQIKFGVSCYHPEKSQHYVVVKSFQHACGLFSKKQESEFQARSENNGNCKEHKEQAKANTKGKTSQTAPILACRGKAKTNTKGKTQTAPHRESSPYILTHAKTVKNPNCDSDISQGQHIVSSILSDILDQVLQSKLNNTIKDLFFFFKEADKEKNKKDMRVACFNHVNSGVWRYKTGLDIHKGIKVAEHVASHHFINHPHSLFSLFADIEELISYHERVPRHENLFDWKPKKPKKRSGRTGAEKRRYRRMQQGQHIVQDLVTELIEKVLARASEPTMPVTAMPATPTTKIFLPTPLTLATTGMNDNVVNKSNENIIISQGRFIVSSILCDIIDQVLQSKVDNEIASLFLFFKKADRHKDVKDSRVKVYQTISSGVWRFKTGIEAHMQTQKEGYIAPFHNIRKPSDLFHLFANRDEICSYQKEAQHQHGLIFPAPKKRGRRGGRHRSQKHKEQEGHQAAPSISTEVTGEVMDRASMPATPTTLATPATLTTLATPATLSTSGTPVTLTTLAAPATLTTLATSATLTTLSTPVTLTSLATPATQTSPGLPRIKLNLSKHKLLYPK